MRLMVTLQQGDCLTLMCEVPDQSVDLVLCDLPYGVTDCRWDHKIAPEPLWEQYLRLVKERGVIALFAQQPFATELASQAARFLRYEWVWDKGQATGFQNAHRMPMRRHENVLVFYRRPPAYHPQGLRPCRRRQSSTPGSSEVYRNIHRDVSLQQFTGYPQSILRFGRDTGSVACQKPIALLEYLIRTYTTEGATVLDNAMGTGSTGVAAVRTGRAFIGFEIDPQRFQIAEGRIREATQTALPAAQPLQARPRVCTHGAKRSQGSERGQRQARARSTRGGDRKAAMREKNA
jgi:site-specific DNA-methyltransferase (adenine-specific)